MTQFFAELKRRRVPRVVLVYVATAFAIIQGADLVVPRVGLPDWIVTALLVIALIGLPVAVVLAWMFDITPDGVQRAEDAAPAQRWLSPRTVSIVVVAFGATASMAWYAGRAGARTNIEDATRSIAVLPFVNVGGAVGDAHFTDGLADELLNLLGRIDGLKVAARTSSFAFRDRANDIRMIGDSLGVLTVLEGTVRRDGDRVRVTANLVNVADGMNVWSDQYNDDITNIFQIQERLARAIARQLELRLGRGDAVAGKRTVNLEAFDLYLQGRDEFLKRAGAAHVHNAIALFNRAITIDPDYAQAHGALAMAFAVLPGFDTVSTQWAATRVHEHARRAIALDDRLPEPYTALCQSLGLGEWRWAEAEEACRAALHRNASFETAHAWLGELLGVHARFDEAMTSFDRARLLDPYSPIIHQMAGLAAFNARDLARADYLMARTRQLDSLLVPARYIAAAIDIEQGEMDSARAKLAPVTPPQQLDMFLRATTDAAIREMVGPFMELGIDRRQPDWASGNAMGFALIGDYERALKYLQFGFERHDFTIAVLVGSPSFDAVRDDPRYIAVVRGIGLDPDALARARAMRVNEGRN